jgi:hypothetical protein
MTMNNLQFDDAMICRLVDAHSEGVDFSHAIDLAHIPEIFAPAAKEFWDTLDGTALFRNSLTPRNDIIDRIFARVDSPVREHAIASLRPSPYMKYVMAFAVPMAVLVLVVGVSLRPVQGPVAQNADDAPLAVSTFSIIPDTSIPTPNTALPLAKSAPALASAALRAAPVAKSVVPAAVKPVPKNDPRQLFAMLKSAGEREARSEATIDEAYDAQLTALNDTVVTPVNPQNNAPLQ